MKKLLLLLFMYSNLIAGFDTFKRGINLTNWFQADSVEAINFAKYNQSDFEDIKSLGVDIIRLPINLMAMTDGAPNYKIDPLLFEFLDQVIQWSEALDMNLVIDNHTFDVNENTSPDIGEFLIPVWKQIAEHYKNASSQVFYEVLNEPHGISDEMWNKIQISVVKAIRKIDTKHTIVVGPAGWNSLHHLEAMPIYDDDNLIYTFHFYDPFIFTHQGASWTTPSMVPLADIPFPYSANKMPVSPDPLKDTWVGGNMRNYAKYGNVDEIKKLIQKAEKFARDRGVTLWCGEFGVLRYNAPDADRTFWYQKVREYLEESGIAWTIWDYHGGFGVFEKNSNELFDHDLNIPLLESLGFKTLVLGALPSIVASGHCSLRHWLDSPQSM